MEILKETKFYFSDFDFACFRKDLEDTVKPKCEFKLFKI